MTPAVKPRELVLAIENSTGDVTLKLDGTLPGKMEPGGELEFEGVARSFQKDPFTVTFDVEKAKLTGWTGKNEAVKRSSGAKKSATNNKKTNSARSEANVTFSTTHKNNNRLHSDDGVRCGSSPPGCAREEV